MNLENLQLNCALMLIRNRLKYKREIRLTRVIASLPTTAPVFSTKKAKGMRDYRTIVFKYKLTPKQIKTLTRMRHF